MDKNIKFILEKLPDEIREIYDICLKSGNNLTEIHIRANQNTYVQINGKNKEIAGTFINCEKIKEITFLPSFHFLHQQYSPLIEQQQNQQFLVKNAHLTIFQ